MYRNKVFSYLSLFYYSINGSWTMNVICWHSKTHLTLINYKYMQVLKQQLSYLIVFRGNSHIYPCYIIKKDYICLYSTFLDIFNFVIKLQEHICPWPFMYHVNISINLWYHFHLNFQIHPVIKCSTILNEIVKKLKSIHELQSHITHWCFLVQIEITFFYFYGEDLSWFVIQ